MFKILFGFEGRIGRLTFWMVMLAQTLLFGAFTWGLMSSFTAAFGDVMALENAGALSEAAKMKLAFEAMQMSVASIALFILLLLFMLFTQAAVYIKRLHDLNMSGWFLTLNYVAFPVSMLIFAMNPSLGPVAFFLMLAPIGLAVFCGFFRGTHGPNRYGEDTIALFEPSDEGDWQDRVKNHKQKLRAQSEAMREKEEAPVRTRGRARPAAQQQSGFGRRGTA